MVDFRYPSDLTFLGKITPRPQTDGDPEFYPQPGGSQGDGHLSFDPTGTWVQLYWTGRGYVPATVEGVLKSCGQFARRERTYQGEMNENWDGVDQSQLVYGGWSKPQIPTIAGDSGCSENTDTNCYFYNPRLKRHFVYFQATPGTIYLHATPAETNVGRWTAVQAAWSDDNDNVNRVWNRQNGEFVLDPDGHPQAQPFIEVEQSPGVNQWQGGFSEISVVWDEDNQRCIMFLRGLHRPGGVALGSPGRWDWSLLRAVEVAPYDGLHFELWSEEPVFSQYIHLTPEQWGYEGSTGHWDIHAEPRVKGGLHMVWQDGQAEVGHAYSSDWGITWTPNPNNPLITLAYLNNILGANTIGLVQGPSQLIDESTGRHYISFTGSAVSSYTEASFYMTYFDRGKPEAVAGRRRKRRRQRRNLLDEQFWNNLNNT